MTAFMFVNASPRHYLYKTAQGGRKAQGWSGLTVKCRKGAPKREAVLDAGSARKFDCGGLRLDRQRFWARGPAIGYRPGTTASVTTFDDMFTELIVGGIGGGAPIRNLTLCWFNPCLGKKTKFKFGRRIPRHARDQSSRNFVQRRPEVSPKANKMGRNVTWGQDINYIKGHLGEIGSIFAADSNLGVAQYGNTARIPAAQALQGAAG